MKSKPHISFASCLALLALSFIICLELAAAPLARPKAETVLDKKFPASEFLLCFEEDDGDEQHLLKSPPCLSAGLFTQPLALSSSIFTAGFNRVHSPAGSPLFIVYRVLRL